MSIWQKRIEVLGVTGEFESGKTLFLTTIDPQNTLLYDAEKSAGLYDGLGFTRVDLPSEMMRAFPKGYKPIDLFKWWYAHIRQIPAGRFSVIALDPVSEIEDGLADYVLANPQEFGKTANQYARSGGLFWGDVKAFWKQILSDLASRCETFAFTSHTSSVWAGNQPVPGQRKPKGKETLMELSSLYLWLERKADNSGNKRPEPAARVLKSRIADTRIIDGKPRVIPLLPPRLPIATPDAIREYMKTPPDYANLKDDERDPGVQMTDDDRAMLRLQTAEAERDAAALKLEIAKVGGQPQDIQPPAPLQAPEPQPAPARPVQPRPEPAPRQQATLPDKLTREMQEAAILDQTFTAPKTPDEGDQRMRAYVAKLGCRAPQGSGCLNNGGKPDACYRENRCIWGTGGELDDQTGLPKIPKSEMVAPGLAMPHDTKMIAFIRECRERTTFDDLAPMFKTAPIAHPMDWERHSMVAALCLHAVKVSAHQGHVQRIKNWLSKQAEDIQRAVSQALNEAAQLRINQGLPAAP